jgi:aminoglycoside 2'-N-acetyltransferase I
MTSLRVPVVDTMTRLSADEATDVRSLMDAAFGERFDDHDFAHALGGTHLVIREGARIVSHAAVVRRRLCVGESELSCGYLEAVATLPALQGRGLGRLVVAAANEVIGEQFEVGALSTGSPRFYEHLGWRGWRGPAHVVVGGEWVRTPDEDDGVMVLAVADGPILDPTTRIAVDDRPGDAW